MTRPVMLRGARSAACSSWGSSVGRAFDPGNVGRVEAGEFREVREAHALGLADIAKASGEPPLVARGFAFAGHKKEEKERKMDKRSKVEGRYWGNVVRILVAVAVVVSVLALSSSAKAKPMSEAQRSKLCAEALAAGQIAIWDGEGWYDCTGETIPVDGDAPGPGCGVLLECTGGGSKPPGGGEPGGSPGGSGGGTGTDDGGEEGDCKSCEQRGDLCGKAVSTFEAVCLSRFKKMARNHCVTHKTDYRGMPLTDYECHSVEVGGEVFVGDELGGWWKPATEYVCSGPGIEQCAEDFGADHAGSGFAGTLSSTFDFDSMFGAGYEESFTLMWGGTTGYRSACFGKAAGLQFQCVTEESKCAMDAGGGAAGCEAAPSTGFDIEL